MSEYKPGDWILIRAQVVTGIDSDGDYRVNLAYGSESNADGYVGASLIIGPTDAPIPDEPDHIYLVVDRDGDPWIRHEEGWRMKLSHYPYTWPDLIKRYGPVTLYLEAPQ